jgi:hypothetical protein
MPNYIHVKVKLKRGNWVLAHSSRPLNIREGVEVEMILPPKAFVDPGLVALLSEVREVELLPAGATVRVAVSTKSVKKEDTPALIQQRLFYVSGVQAFIEVELKEPLVLIIQGTKDGHLKDCACCVPMLNLEATSLNHAYTLISEKIETHRKSHAGNVFDLTFFEDNLESWKPLRIAKDRHLL